MTVRHPEPNISQFLLQKILVWISWRLFCFPSLKYLPFTYVIYVLIIAHKRDSENRFKIGKYIIIQILFTCVIVSSSVGLLCSRRLWLENISWIKLVQNPPRNSMWVLFSCFTFKLKVKTFSNRNFVTLTDIIMFIVESCFKLITSNIHQWLWLFIEI